jgi:Leucine-rich repeat (LRR) protein
MGADAFDPWDGIDVKDPFNQLPTEPNGGLLRKRVEAARTSGSLNIAAMALKDIPEEVMTMYDYDPDSNAEWYESVDLVKFIAADNEIESLPDAVFPDIDPHEFDSNEDSKGNQFGGLEVLDLHGNLLRSLPVGLRRLPKLSSLNLSNNQLRMDDLEVVIEIHSLSDLKLANNNLEGTLLSTIGRLNNLEILDLRGNRLRSLPDSVSDLTSLKVLNISDNQLQSLPFETLSRLPMIELNAAGNKLQGSLIPASVHRFETLQTLNVARNALARLSENDTFDFPNLQTLAVDANRLEGLPCISSWRTLLRLSAEGNNIAALPDGFLELGTLRHVDLTANSLSKLDERIGLMDNLVTFRIANNPLRERKFLTMDTEDLKRDLRNRCAPPPQERKSRQSVSHEAEETERDGEDPDEEDEGSVATEFTLAPESPSHLNRWKVKPGGVLDRSSTEMAELNVDELKPLVSTHDIRCLYIQRNKLQSFPIPALSLIASTLTDLDLSYNPLNSDTFLAVSLSLPHLQSLNLSATGLTSLDSLQTNCSAPSLKFLDVSNNRLAGPLPTVRHTYPNLITFLAADNQISSLHFESVQGLQVLDVSNNNIDFLPPKLGLLAAEGSGPGLRRFEVAGNSFRVPRWQVVTKGTEAVLEWLKHRIPAEELKDWGDAGHDEIVSAGVA